MKLTELRKVIREEVKAAIQEELKDILLEAVKTPTQTTLSSTPAKKTTVTESTQPDPQAQKAFRQQMLSQMSAAGGNLNLSTADNANTFVPSGPTSGEGSALGAGTVGLDQIMGIMNSK
tara:strand:+ start:59 stop:415 length:357 start_codon:yes stop_codon:yes gene_type:complete